MPSFFARLNSNGRMVAVGVVAGYPPEAAPWLSHRTHDPVHRVRMSASP